MPGRIAAEPARPLRIAIGAILGILIAFGTIWLVELVEAFLYPPTMPVDWQDREAVAVMVAAIPTAGKLMIAGGWLIGPLLGALAATAIGGRAIAGWIPAAMVLVGSLLNLLTIPHPWWMAAAAIVLPVLGGWLGTRLASGRR